MISGWLVRMVIVMEWEAGARRVVELGQRLVHHIFSIHVAGYQAGRARAKLTATVAGR